MNSAPQNSALQDPQSQPSSQAGLSSANPTPSRRRLFGVLAAGLAGVGASLAFHRSAHAHGGRWGRHHGGPVDAETMGKRIDAMVAYVLADVDATPEQKDKIATIAKAAANDLMPLRKQHQDARKQALELLSAPAIDRARFETLRVSQMQLGETATRRATQALLDVAETLTPQQRQQLAQKMQRRHSRMG